MQSGKLHTLHLNLDSPFNKQADDYNFIPSNTFHSKRNSQQYHSSAHHSNSRLLLNLERNKFVGESEQKMKFDNVRAVSEMAS
jgi:hypothetical protein